MQRKAESKEKLQKMVRENFNKENYQALKKNLKALNDFQKTRMNLQMNDSIQWKKE